MRRINSTYTAIVIAAVIVMIATGCSMQKNTAVNRWRNAFTARYNTYYNGSQAFIDGAQEKEKGNQDNFTELIPLYTVSNKTSRDLGRGNFERAIEKAEKAIKLHSMKQRPEWTKARRKTAEDIEWLNRKEYNPFIWKAWLLMGKAQFQMGNFDEAASTFSYMSRLYATQPDINGIARAWLAKSYVELDWLYDAEDVITKMRRDTMHYRAVADWDYTYADFYVKSGQYKEAVPYLYKVIKHEKRSKQKAREWFLMGQLQSVLGNSEEAYKAYGRVIRLNPPYELMFNARIAQTEVMAAKQSKKMIRKLRSMARSDNNANYLDQVYYAIGNIYLAQQDTANAIAAYETGNKEAKRSGFEKGVLLLKLGNLYWEKEKFNDAQRCYGEAIGMLDKERPDYEEMSKRSMVLDELVPFTDAVYLQDSLQTLAALPEGERNAAIDRVIDELKKKEKEEKRAAEEAEAEKRQQQQGNSRTQRVARNAPTATNSNQGVWYFYNPTAVNQGKAAFQKQWGKRDNTDDWQRSNRTVVNLNAEEIVGDSVAAVDSLANDSLSAMGEAAVDAQTKDKNAIGVDDELAEDPHNREYYLAQIPFTDEQKAESDNIIKDGLYNAGIIFKNKLENLTLGEKALVRLTQQYSDYEKNDETWYHLWLLYSRQGNHVKADSCLSHLQATYPDSKWTLLLSDPHFAENAQFGEHIEDSLYAATYEAFKGERHEEIKSNAKISRERFPYGFNRPKFIFIEGLALLNEGNAQGCLDNMKEVVEKHPDNEVSPLAGMIIKGVQAGRQLHGGSFDIGDVWARRGIDMMESDSTITDTLTIERNTGYTFLLAYATDSINENQLLYEMARYNFSNFMVRNFDMTIDEDRGIRRMLVSGFMSYDEALQYARHLATDTTMTRKLHGCKRIVISDDNLKLLGTKYSYNDYETFFDQSLAPLPVSEEELLNVPDIEPVIIDGTGGEQPDTTEDANETLSVDDDLFNGLPPLQQTTTQQSGNDLFDMPAPPANNSTTQPEPQGFDFEEDFYR